jgi:hypothetical protein
MFHATGLSRGSAALEDPPVFLVIEDDQSIQA